MLRLRIGRVVFAMGSIACDGAASRWSALGALEIGTDRQHLLWEIASRTFVLGRVHITHAAQRGLGRGRRRVVDITTGISSIFRHRVVSLSSNL